MNIYDVWVNKLRGEGSRAWRVVLFWLIVAFLAAGIKISIHDYLASLSGWNSIPINHSNEGALGYFIAILPQLVQVIAIGFGISLLTEKDGDINSLEKNRLIGSGLILFGSFAWLFDITTDKLFLQVSGTEEWIAWAVAIGIFWGLSELVTALGLGLFLTLLPDAITDHIDLVSEIYASVFKRDPSGPKRKNFRSKKGGGRPHNSGRPPNLP